MAMNRHITNFILAILLAVGAGGTARADSKNPQLLQSIMARLAAQPDREASFTEEKHLSSLNAPLHIEGRLVFRHPAHLEKITTSPKPERLVVDAGQLSIAQGDASPRTLSLDDHPDLRALTSTIVATLAGDLPALQRFYTVDATGSQAQWRMILHPVDASVRHFVQQVTIDGAGPAVRQLSISQSNGDTQTMLISAAK